MAWARRDLPVPGGPYSKIRFHGFRPPGREKRPEWVGSGAGEEADKEGHGYVQPETNDLAGKDASEKNHW